MTLKDKLLSIKQKVLNGVLQKEAYWGFGNIPRKIRKSYFDLFVGAVDKESVQRNYVEGFEKGQGTTIFSGGGGGFSRFFLKYGPDFVDLKVSMSCIGAGDNKRIREDGVISTRYNEEHDLQTYLEVGDNFKFNSGFGGNQAISALVRKVQDSKIIPNFSSENMAAVILNTGSILDYETIKIGDRGFTGLTGG